MNQLIAGYHTKYLQKVRKRGWMMQVKDARSISPQGQEALRKRAVRAVLSGMKQTAAARTFGVARGTVARWMSQYRQDGEAALDKRPQGRPSAPRLKGEQEAAIVALIECHCPDQLGLPCPLWTRESVGALIRRRFGLAFSVWTVGRYLRRWGLTPQKPARRAYEQDPEAVRRWLAEEYPQIQMEAREEGAEIHWGDEMGVRSDHQAGRTWGRKGKTPVVRGTGQRFRYNVISTLTNQGILRFRVFQENFNGEVFINFLRRLVRDRGKKVYLIVDRHPVHISRKVQQWVERHRTEIRLIYLPPYSPELNPGEFLNQDVKTNAAGRWRPSTKGQMMKNLRGYLRSTQKCPNVVQRFFHAESVRYAAA
jgi:transposase